MINTQEVIERSIYQAIQNKCLLLGYSLDPNNYYPITPESEKRYKDDLSKIELYVQVFGTSNPQAKGEKISPRIVIESKGFYPGSMGLEPYGYDLQDDIYVATEVATETFDQYIDISIIADTQNHIRILHNLLYQSIPQRGYLKPYYAETVEKTGNIYMELVNYFDNNSNDHGIIEKVYQFAITDCLLELQTDLENLSPIKEATVILENPNQTELINIP